MSTALAQHRAEVFARDADRRGRCRCALEGAGPCRGELQADHILKWRPILRYRADLIREGPTGPRRADALRLRTMTEDEVKADPRNGWVLCERHHGLKDRRLLDGPVACRVVQLEHYVAFLTELGLWNLHHRYLLPR